MEKQKFLIKTLPLCVGVFVLSIIIGYAVLAWTEPNTTPPGGNIAAPINTGSVTQTKTGDLGWGTAGARLNTDQGASIELRGTGTPYIDFSNDASTDYDGRMILTNNDALSVEGADLNANVRLCIKGTCCDSWASCVSLGGGGGGGGGGGSNMLPQSACANTLSAGNRRIFVTSQSYKGSSYNTVAKADDICYNAAKNAGMPETEAKRFYALVAVADRNPMDLLTASKYWNGVKIGSTTECNWNYIGSPSTMFSDSGLSHPINHDQWGNQVGNSATAMTSFKQTGGSIELLNAGNFGSGLCSQTSIWTKKGPCGGRNTCWFGGCASGACMYCCDTYKHWYGDVNDPKKWAYAGVWGVGTAANCNDVGRALYCVEKY